MPKVKATVGSKVKSCLQSYLSQNLKTTETNLLKLKHNEKVCHIQDIGGHAHGQGH